MKEPICIACDITERMTRLKSRPGNRFGSENPCLSVCRQVGSSHCLGILPTMLGPPGRPNIHCSSATGGVHRVPRTLGHRCYQPHLRRGAMADGTMEGLAEMEDRRASQRENSVGDDLPPRLANTPRRQPPDNPPLSDGAHPRYPIESTDKNLVPQTYFARSADDSPVSLRPE